MKYSRRKNVRLFASVHVQVVASLRFLGVVFQPASLSRSGTDLQLCCAGEKIPLKFTCKVQRRQRSSREYKNPKIIGSR